MSGNQEETSTHGPLVMRAGSAPTGVKSTGIGSHRATLIDPATGFAARSINLHLDELPPGGRNRNHREANEHIQYILSGRGYTIIDGVHCDWEAGDAVFIPSGAWHQYVNPDPVETARFLVATNKPMIRNLGLDWQEVAPDEAPPEG